MKKEFQYTMSDVEGIKVLNVLSSISSLNIKEFGNLLEDLTQKSNVIINMEKVMVITTAGLNTLVEACLNARKRGKRIVLMGVRSEFIKLIEQVEMFEYFIFVDSINEGQLKIKYYT